MLDPDTNELHSISCLEKLWTSLRKAVPFSLGQCKSAEGSAKDSYPTGRDRMIDITLIYFQVLKQYVGL